MVVMICGMTAQLRAQLAVSPAESGPPTKKARKTATEKEDKSGANKFFGAGNNPHVIRMLAAIAKALPLEEGTHISGSPSSSGDRTQADIIYPNQGKK